MRIHFAIALAVLAAGPSDEATRQDIEKWQGVWHVVSMETDVTLASEAQLKKISLTVKGTDYHFQNGDFSERGIYQFRAGKNPKELDIVVGEGNDKGKIYQAIYQVDAQELKICLDVANKLRPREFSGKAGSGCVLEVWRRAKP